MLSVFIGLTFNPYLGNKKLLKLNMRTSLIILMLLMQMLSTNELIAQEKHKIVTAQNGDGIISLQTRHGLSPKTYQAEFIGLNKQKLGKNNALFIGVKYKLPISKTSDNKAKSLVLPIFGKKYQNVKIEDDQLKGAIFYLVAGHGGPDPGAVGNYGNRKLCEDEYAYDVTLRLARNLMQHGATVHMITKDQNDGIRDASYLPADKDERCHPNKRIPINQLKRLKQRTKAVNDLYRKNRNAKYQRVLIIHLDSRSKRENIDVFFYHDKRSKSGKLFSQNLLNTFNAKYRKFQPGRGYQGTISTRELYVLANTYPTATFIELGNINNQRDLLRFIKSDNRQALANWLFEGILHDFKTNKL